MLRRHLNSKDAQVFMEYTIVIGIIGMILFAMSPMFKRGIQGMIKVVADQIGTQENSDQRFDDRGHMESAFISTRASIDKLTQETGGVTNYVFGDVITTDMVRSVNLGFTEEN